jgi:hypothetical protein
MSMDTNCTYREHRGEILIAYLYNEIDSTSRETFERHLAACETCSRELTGLRGVRTRLEQWAPPEPAGWRVSSRPVERERPQQGRVLSGASGAGAARGWRKTITDLPAWAQAAAAILVLGVAASIANLQVRYDDAGLTVRTGWLTPAVPEPAPAPASDPAPWRVELTALRDELRNEMRASAESVVAARDERVDRNALLRRMQALIEDSELKQQRELALRIAEVDTSALRRRDADLRTIERNLTAIRSNTGMDMRRLYDMTNDLAVRVSQTR